MNPDRVSISTAIIPRIDETECEIVERKGAGHPDTLCDAIAEKISQAYARYCLEHYGIILRHMVDKIALSGGSSKVWFGGGEMQKPVRLYLNCRFTRTFNGQEVPYLDIVKRTVHEHFKEVLPLLDQERYLTIIDNTHSAQGPGVVYEADGSTRNEREHFFDVPAREYAAFHDNGLRANDTSTTVSYGPLSATEKIAVFVESWLNSRDFKDAHPYVGTDIKVMVCRAWREVHITACVPFVAIHTPSYEFYAERLTFLQQAITTNVTSRFPDYKVTVALNTRDNREKSDHYLTLTGSAIESGDEGAVGRGNRYNGVIPFTRHASLEACCGKNPVYHVGKLYTAIGSRVAQEIYDRLGLETCVFLTSQMGRPLSDPWFVRIEVAEISVNQEQRRQILDILDHYLAQPQETTMKIVEGSLRLY